MLTFNNVLKIGKYNFRILAREGNNLVTVKVPNAIALNVLKSGNVDIYTDKKNSTPGQQKRERLELEVVASNPIRKGSRHSRWESVDIGGNKWKCLLDNNLNITMGSKFSVEKCMLKP